MEVDPPARIAILGAGPIGLEAALYARYLGYEVQVYERGRVGENVLRWGHVRLFSPFGMNASPLALAALAAQHDAWRPPAADALLTGRQYVEQYLRPLAASDLLDGLVHEQTEVLALGRAGVLKGELLGDPRRARSPFRLLLRSPRGQRTVAALVVLDTTGVYGNANWLGRGGTPAVGERSARRRIEYGLPDVLVNREHYAGRSVLVAGSGYSAATTVAALAELAEGEPTTRVLWVTRQPADGDGPIPTIASDRLPERDALARAANALARGGSGAVEHRAATTVQGVRWLQDAGEFEVRLRASSGWGETVRVQRVVANVGYRPDRGLWEELHVHECYASGGPMKLAAALLGQTSADCLDQASAGPAALVTPEPNFYVLGAKSYGRNSRFLISVGLQQVREVFTLIGGRATLDLYATAQVP